MSTEPASAPESAPPSATRPLGRCGNYELLVELASGGMATVFLARHAQNREAPLVAVKRPHKHLAGDKVFLSMLVDEARLASSIQHGNVVKVHELGFDAGEPFIVMDYVEGAALSEVRRQLGDMGRALDPRVAVRITLDALSGLHAAHVLHDDKGKHLGIVHRDVSPHNILLGCDGHARLTDFGIAKAADRVQVTRTHEVKGKLAYLAPERIDKRRLCTVQSDVFSMAVVLWECIAGRRLFRGEEAIDTLQEVMTAPIVPLRKLGVKIAPDLDDVIVKGLAREMEDRWETAAEFAVALSRASGGPDAVARPAEVEAMIEALFGEQLRVRHAQIRAALPGVTDTGVAEVLRLSGLHSREAPDEEMQARVRVQLETAAPPAPSARYAFGGSADGALRRRLGGRRGRAMLAAGAIVAVAAVVATAIVVARPGARGGAAAEPSFRHVIVPLPFVATRVTFDEQTRDLPAPADVAAFDVPRESGPRHRVTAMAVDGARAEAVVREAEGMARPEGDGFAIETLETIDPSAASASAPPGASAASAAPVAADLPPNPRGVKRHPAPRPHGKPVGTVKDGFTKLK